MNVEIALVIVISCNLVFTAWLWYRARSESDKLRSLPMLLVLSIAMLVGILPRVLWPEAERVKIGGSIASIVLSIVAMILSVWGLASAARRRHHD